MNDTEDTENEAEESTEKKERGEMSFLDHLEELRWVLVKSAVTFVVSCGLVIGFMGYFSGFLKWPLDRAMDRMGMEIGSLVTISPMGVFTVLLLVAFLGGVALSFPFILYYFSSFLAPGLTRREKRVLLPGCMAALLLFLAGAAFCYYFILPISLFFSMKFNQMMGLEIVWSADRYYNFVVWMIMAIGGSFQFPLILILLVYVGIVTPEQLKGARNIVVVIILGASAIITPSDPISMLILAGPLYLLYELAIIVGAMFLRKKKAREAEEEAEIYDET